MVDLDDLPEAYFFGERTVAREHAASEELAEWAALDPELRSMVERTVALSVVLETWWDVLVEYGRRHGPPDLTEVMRLFISIADHLLARGFTGLTPEEACAEQASREQVAACLASNATEHNPLGGMAQVLRNHSLAELYLAARKMGRPLPRGTCRGGPRGRRAAARQRRAGGRAPPSSEPLSRGADSPAKPSDPIGRERVG